MKISIIVPIYNMQNFIRQSITCLKSQDINDVEYLLINDGSTDDTLSNIEALCSGDTRFKIFTKKNRGYGHTCNFGISHATGDYIGIFEPDDSITDDFYPCLLQHAERYRQADVIKYNGIYKNEQGTIKKLFRWNRKYTGVILEKHDMKRFWRSHPAIFNGIYRRSFIQQKSVYFCETAGASFQDAMFYVSLYYANPSIYIINDTKYIYTIHEQQSIHFADSKIEDIIKMWRMEWQWIEENGFIDKNFLLYQVFKQLMSLKNAVSHDNFLKLRDEFRKMKDGNAIIKSDIPTWKQKIQYALA